MAKFCSNCGKELDERADICLNCGVLVNKTINNNISSNANNGKKKGLPAWAIVLIVVGSVILIPLIIIVLFRLFVFDAIKEDAGKYLEKVKDYFSEQVEDYKIIGEGTIGDTLEFDDVKFTLNSANIYSSIGDNTLNNDKEYLVFFFDVENTNDDDELITYLNFRGYFDKDELIPKFIFNKIDGISNLNKDLSSGEKTKGYIAFEVNRGWTNFNLYYGDLLGKEKIAFYVTNKNSSEEM